MDEVEVPSHFLCPISLQLMRDPVTVSTGITYDRESIERWLFSFKNNICPVSKQVLLLYNDTDLITPNHTLRRLIQAWCILNAIDRIPTPAPPIDKSHIIKLLSDSKKSPILKLRGLGDIAFQSERNRICLEEAGVPEFLALTLSNLYSSSDEFDHTSTNASDINDEALRILYYMNMSGTCLKNLINKNNGEFVDVLIKVLKHESYQSRAYATMLLKSLYAVADPIRLTTLNGQLFVEIIRVLHDHQISQQVGKAALKLLVEVCPWGRNRIKAVESGLVHVLVDHLLEISHKRSAELALVALDQLCGCAEGRAELLKHGAGIAIVSKKILRVSHLASEKAVRILSSICKFSATSRVLQEMLQVGVVSKLCLVLQVECGSKTKEKARDILKLHSRVWRNSLCIPSHLLSYYPAC
ncbi:hypothetical protein ACFE04_012791 [Oxalis oulophora]